MKFTGKTFTHKGWQAGIYTYEPSDARCPADHAVIDQPVLLAHEAGSILCVSSEQLEDIAGAGAVGLHWGWVSYVQNGEEMFLRYSCLLLEDVIHLLYLDECEQEAAAYDLMKKAKEKCSLKQKIAEYSAGLDAFLEAFI